MNISIETAHNKIVTKHDILMEFSKYLEKIVRTAEYAVPDEISKSTIPTTQKTPARKTTKAIKLTKAPEYCEYINNLISPRSSVMDRCTNLVAQCTAAQNKYYDVTASIISRYYDLVSSEKIDPDTYKNILEEYRQIIVSNNCFDQMDRCLEIIMTIGIEIYTEPLYKTSSVRIDFLTDALLACMGVNRPTRVDFREVVQKMREVYDDNKITFTAVKKVVNNCEQCGLKMTVYPNTSEMRCDSCGATITLYGTVFEDSQFFTQQGQCTKHKKYDPNRHCEKWLNQIQANENKTIPPKIIEKINKKSIKEYTRGGKVRSMSDMKCRQIREWFKEEKEEKLTKYNDHAALIRKIITGQNGEAIIPPQLTVEENQEILIDFSRAMDLYEKLRKREDILQMFGKAKIRNKLYYPYGLLKILCHKLKNDPRKNGLIECIHFQSTNTIKKDDAIWQEICKELEGYEYEPTDRTILVDIV
jgi:hypothetical protein